MNQDKKILLVDDDPPFINLYTAVFQSFGFNFSVAQNGLEALDKAKKEHPYLILLDIMMPEMSGFEVLNRLKQDPQTKDITVWMITNLPEQMNKEKAISLGATDYLFKSSYTPKRVCQKIQEFLGDQTSETPTKTV